MSSDGYTFSSDAAPDRKRNRSEGSSASNQENNGNHQHPADDDDVIESQAPPPQPPGEEEHRPSSAAMVETSAATLELIGNTFAGVHRSVVDALRNENAHTVSLVHDVVSDTTAMARIAADAAHNMLAKSDQLLRACAESDSLKGALACREQEVRSGLTTIARLATDSAASVNVAKAASASAAAEIAVLRRQCDTLTTALKQTGDAHREKEAALAARIAQLEGSNANAQLATARLQCGLRWANEKATGQREETVRMVQVMQQLCNIKKTEEGSALDLAQSRSQVKRLERYLQLNDIVAAMVPPDAPVRQQLHSASRPSDDGRRPPLPHPSVKDVAPNFFALRLLEHKDVSIAELVDHWSTQETRVADLTAQLQTQTAAFDKLQRDASRTHALYTEERRRREAEERRVAELQRQRLASAGSAHAAMEELDKLRLQSSTLQDTNAILTVQLRQNRDDRAALDGELSAAKATIAQLAQAGKHDAVVQAVAALKVHYERETSRLHTLFLDATMEGERKATQVVQLQEALHHETATTAQVRAAYASVVAALKRSEQLVAQLQRKADDAWRQAAAKDSTTAASLLRLAQQEGDCNVQRPMAAEQQRMRRPANVVFETLGKVLKSLDAVHAIHQEAPDTSATPSSSAVHAPTRSSQHDAAVIAELRQSLRAAMTYTVVQLESTQQIRNYFVDVQTADASCMHALYQTLKRTVDARDDAQRKLEQCQAFVEKHGLEAVESVLMHEVDRSAASPKAAAGRGAAMMEEEEVLLLRAKAVEHEAHSSQLKQQLTSQQQAMCELSHDLAEARAMHTAARRETAIWKGILDKEREVIAALTDAWVFARHCEETHAAATATTGAGSEERALVDVVRTEAMCSAEEEERASTSTEPVQTETVDREEIDIDADDDNNAVGDEQAGDATAEPQQTSVDGNGTTGQQETEEEHLLPAASPSADVVVYNEASIAVPQQLQQCDDGAHASSLASLLANITKTLQDVRDRTAAMGEAASAAAANASRGPLVDVNGSDPADATRTFEVAVAERVERNGIGAIATLLREIYEASGVVQRQRTALAGADAAQETTTSGLMLETLQRRCAALEALEAKRAAELVAMADRHAAEVKATQDQLAAKHAAELQQREADIRARDAALEGATQRAAQLDAEVQRQQQEVAKSAQMNTQLLGFVKQLQARLQQATASSVGSGGGGGAAGAPTATSTPPAPPPVATATAAAAVPPPDGATTSQPPQ